MFTVTKHTPKRVTNLILEAMPASFQVHLLGIWVIELALTQLAIEADSFALLIAHFLYVLMTYNRSSELSPA